MSRLSTLTPEQQRSYDNRMPEDYLPEPPRHVLDDEAERRYEEMMEARRQRNRPRYRDDGADRWEMRRQRQENRRLDAMERGRR